MTDLRGDAEDLLREMKTSLSPVDSEGAARVRRERTVAHLRGLQARAVVRRELGGSWRKRLLVAAVVLLPSGAFAATIVSWERFVEKGKVPVPMALHHAVTSKPDGSDAKFRGAAEPSGASSISSAAASLPHAEEVPAPPRSLAEPARASLSSTAAGMRPASTLRQENDLMQAALAAGRSGDDRRAVHLLTELLSRYPASQLAQNAIVERFRALARIGDERSASREARRYLSEHPNGMAASEAERLAGMPQATALGNARFE